MTVAVEGGYVDMWSRKKKKKEVCDLGRHILLYFLFLSGLLIYMQVIFRELLFY